MKIPKIVKALFGAQIAFWARMRLLHVPEAQLGALARKVGVTPEQWRAVESELANRVDAALSEG